MWEMFDTDFDCGPGCGPPPKFLLPPPPRPPFMQELNTKCSEDPIHDAEVCDAITSSDPSFQSSPLLQTPALIALCSVALVLIVLISGLVIWKLKRKVQNFLPCKTPTRGGHLDPNGMPRSGQLATTYEDPDAHMGHSPLVLGHPQFQHRNHHNLELLHSKAIHYPGGFPMVRSPPLFISSSPGPDPYRSHDNVYEELGPPTGPVRCDSEAGESEHASHSDDEFAEDELSLAGESSFQKNQNQVNNGAGTSSASNQHPGTSSLDTTTASTSSSTATTNTLPRSGSSQQQLPSQSPPQQQTVSTIYKEYPPLTASNYIDGLIVEDNNNLINQAGQRHNSNERNPLLLMNGQQQQPPFSHHHHHHPIHQYPPYSNQQQQQPPHPHHYPTVVGMSMTTGRPSAASSCCGGASNNSGSTGSAAGRSLNRLMNPSSLFRGRKVHNGRGTQGKGSKQTTAPTAMSLSNVYYDPNQRLATCDRVNNNSNCSSSSNAGNEFMLIANDHLSPHVVEDEVERRNRINRELNSMHTNGGPPTTSANNINNNVATIFRERINGAAPVGVVAAAGGGGGGLGCCPPGGVFYPNGGGSGLVMDYNNGSNNSSGRRSNNCRSLDRRRGQLIKQRGPAIIPNYSAPPPPLAPSSAAQLDNANFYSADYTEPYQHMMFDANHNNSQRGVGVGGGVAGGAGHSQDFLRDSSFGSDSGYSQNTQISHRSGPLVNGNNVQSQQQHHHHPSGTNNNNQGSWFRSSRRNVS